VFVPPAVAGDVVYVGSCSGSLYALDREVGDVAWSYDTSADGPRANFHGSAVLSPELIVIGSDTQSEGRLYAFDRVTGEVRWQHTTAGGFPSDLARLGSGVLALTMSGEVWYADVDTGRMRWKFDELEGEGLLRSSIAIADSLVVVSLPSGQVFTLDPETGKRVWETSFDGRLNTTLAIIGDHVYVGELEGTIHRLAVADGEVLGSFAADGLMYGALIPAGECLLALWGEDTLGCLDHTLETVKWSQTTDTTWSSFQPLVWGEVVVAGTEAGEIRAFKLSDGSPVWSQQLEGEIKGLGAVGDVLFVGTLQGRVYALRFWQPAPGAS
jgi:outer membrane protein assembly factor BamB